MSQIVCDNLVKIYKVADLEVVALQGLDLVVEQGEFIAIVGASGSGKSTLQNILGGMDVPTAGKAEVAAGGMRSIDKLAEWLKKNPTRNLLIEGHTDNTGPEDFNQKLSQQRAEAVRDQLVSRGVPADRITTKGYGPKYPVVANDTASGRQQNRRVEVVVLNEGATADSVAR